VKPSSPPSDALPLSNNGRGGSEARPAQPPTRVPPESTGTPDIAAASSSGSSAGAAFAGVGRWGWLLAGAGVLAAILAIVIAVGFGYNWGSPPPNASSPQAAPAPAPTIGPEVPIPALGTPVQVGKTPGFVAVSPNGRHAYVANRDAQLVTVVDTAINQVTATIPIPAGPPQFLAFAPDGAGFTSPFTTTSGQSIPST
jgi:YVTN family beta-propeller protein